MILEIYTRAGAVETRVYRSEHPVTEPIPRAGEIVRKSNGVERVFGVYIEAIEHDWNYNRPVDDENRGCPFIVRCYGKDWP